MTYLNPTPAEQEQTKILICKACTLADYMKTCGICAFQVGLQYKEEESIMENESRLPVVGDRLTLESGHGYTWHDNGIERFRRAQKDINMTVNTVDKLNLYCITDTGMKITFKWNPSHMWIQA